MRRACVVLAICVLWIVLNRCHTFHQPVGMDVSFYATVAQELREGSLLYSQVWEHKPPLTFLTYGLAQIITGNSDAQFFLLGLLAALGTLVAVFFAGLWGTGRLDAALWAAAFWALSASDLLLEANLPNTEVFQNLFTVWAFALLLRPPRRQWFPLALGVGILFGIASLYKHVMVVVPGCLMLAEASALRQSVSSRQQFLQRWGVIFATGCALWGLTFAYFAATSRAQEFFQCIFQFNKEYIASNPYGKNGLISNLTAAFHPLYWKNNVPSGALNVFLPGLTVLVVGLLSSRASLQRWPWAKWFAYLLGAFLAFALPGRLYGHYFQLWLPPLAIGCGWSLSRWMQATASAKRWIPITGGVLGVLALLIHEFRPLRLTPDQCSEVVWGNLFISDRTMGRRIELLLKPEETMYQWGHETGLYYYSRRRPASGILDISPLYMGPSSARFRARLFEDLERHKPELVVICRWIRPPPNDEVIAWLKKRYHPFPGGSFGSYLFLARSGGALESRMRAPSREKRSLSSGV